MRPSPVLELYRDANTEQAEDAIVHGEELVKEALSRNKGALILTAHLGNWDILSVATTQRGYALTIISKDVKNDAVNSFWMETRAF